MVRRAAPRPATQHFRRGLRCLLGRHNVGYWRLNAEGEKWGTFIYLCKRCRRVVGNSHAARSPTPHV